MRTITIDMRKGYLSADGVPLDCPARSSEVDVHCHIQCAWFESTRTQGSKVFCRSHVMGYLSLTEK